MKTFKEYLHSVDACQPAIEWAGDKPVEQIVAECHRGDWLLWLAKKCGVELQPLTLAKGHCANTVRHLMSDERSLIAVDVAIAFGEGKATREELDAAADAATTAANAAARTSAAATYAAARAAAYAAAYSAAYAAYAAYAFAASATSATDATDASATTAAADAAYAANQHKTADICRKYIGDLIIEKVNQTLNH